MADALPEIPGYTVFGEVGRGAAGVVYRAHQVALDCSRSIGGLWGSLANGQKLVGQALGVLAARYERASDQAVRSVADVPGRQDAPG